MQSSDSIGLLHSLLQFFYLQRCGCDLPRDAAGAFAHPPCHDQLARIYGTDVKVDVTGGWHDAGDYGRYTVPAAKAVADLLLSYLTAPNAYSIFRFLPDAVLLQSGTALPDLLLEIRYELTWLLKMQRADGAVYHKVSCADFCGFVLPQFETDELIVSPVSTTATGDFAGVMALAYMAYRALDAAFAATCLQAAERAYAFLKNTPPIPFHNPAQIHTGEYDDDVDTDERFFAAAALHAATGCAGYGWDALALSASDFPVSLGWADMGGYGCLVCLYAKDCVLPQLYTLASERLAQCAEGLFSASSEDSFGISLSDVFLWGSNMYLASNAVLLCEAARLLHMPAYKAAAQRHVSYLLGNNPLSVCYVTGYQNASPRHPHHRPSAAVGQAMPGMLVGGPAGGLYDDCAKTHLQGKPGISCYIDAQESYSTNEVAIYWNSSLVYLLSLLFLT